MPDHVRSTVPLESNGRRALRSCAPCCQGCIMYELFSRSMLLFNETPATSADDAERYAAKVAYGYR